MENKRKMLIILLLVSFTSILSAQTITIIRVIPDFF